MIIGNIRALLRPVKKSLKRFRKSLRQRPDPFLKDISGVVHVGANLGQERAIYSKLGLRVVWIEPSPEVFIRLNENIRDFQNQRAFQALVTDVDDREYEFHVANNRGESSSILRLKQHKDVWPNVYQTATIFLRSTTLATLYKKERLDSSKYDALVMDTQGSELLVLRGSLSILDSFRFIKTEVADFELYEGCCQLSDINEFMTEHGYKEFSRTKFASRAEGGSCFNIVYEKQPFGQEEK